MDPISESSRTWWLFGGRPSSHKGYSYGNNGTYFIYHNHVKNNLKPPACQHHRGSREVVFFLCQVYIFTSVTAEIFTQHVPTRANLGKTPA